MDVSPPLQAASESAKVTPFAGSHEDRGRMPDAEF